MYYIYDASGDVIGFRYGGNTEYFYGKNAQGDVVALFDSNFELLARYYYDAWGNVISVKDANGNEITDKNNIAHVNPIRYRSYHYESDTGFYYLNSRYYDPKVGRFISEDVYISTGQGILGNNMFAYCNNNPVMFVDPNGNLTFQGEIHQAVVNLIYDLYKNSEYPMYKEQKILYSYGYGRADLINELGYVWEVKPITYDVTKRLKLTNDQLDKYIHGMWKSNPLIKLKRGYRLPSDSFQHIGKDGVYDVSYYYSGDGIIFYSYSKIQPPIPEKEVVPETNMVPIIIEAPKIEVKIPEVNPPEVNPVVLIGGIALYAIICYFSGGMIIAW